MEENLFPKPSQIVCTNFFTIAKTDVIKKIGKIKINFYKEIIKKIKDDVLDI